MNKKQVQVLVERQTKEVVSKRKFCGVWFVHHGFHWKFGKGLADSKEILISLGLEVRNV